MSVTEGKPTNHLLLRAARGESVPRPPVWAMRQAGRWDPEFNKLRAGKTFYEFSEDVELSARASLLPRRFGVDAIILFYDITTLTVSMGLPFTLLPIAVRQVQHGERRHTSVRLLVVTGNGAERLYCRRQVADDRLQPDCRLQANVLRPDLPCLGHAGARNHHQGDENQSAHSTS